MHLLCLFTVCYYDCIQLLSEKGFFFMKKKKDFIICRDLFLTRLAECDCCVC